MLSTSERKKGGGTEPFHRVRLFLSGILQRIQKRQNRASYRFIAGLPNGISPSLLNTVCQDHFEDSALSYTYQHLSGWKAAGAFRLVIKTRRGKEIRLIYKDAIYYPDQIPALIDLPVHPGAPEYAVYSHPEGELAAFLPRVYLAEEVVPGARYRYILEDLGQSHHRFTRQNDFNQLSSLLPRLHQAMREWVNTENTNGFLRYGEVFFQSLHQYALDKLEKYSQHSNEPALISVLRILPQAALLRSEDPVVGFLPHQPVHGDTNFTNFHLLNQDPHHFKVVDWEWAGFGLPHADLASLLKGLPSEIEKSAFQQYIEALNWQDLPRYKDLSYEEHWRLYLWMQMERGLLDAAFLAVQVLQTPHKAKFNLPTAISLSLNQVMKAYQELSQKTVH